MKKQLAIAALLLVSQPAQAQAFDPLMDFVAGRMATVCLAKAGLITVQEGIDMELKAARKKNYLPQYARFNQASSGDQWVGLTVKRKIKEHGGCSAIVNRGRSGPRKPARPAYEL